MVQYMKRSSQVFNILSKLSIDYEMGALDINFPNEGNVINSLVIYETRAHFRAFSSRLIGCQYYCYKKIDERKNNFSRHSCLNNLFRMEQYII